MIGLLTDSKMANIPLMKIASYYKDVEWYYPLNHNNYEKIYYSNIFNCNPKVDRVNEMIVGGTGYSLSKKLDNQIEKCQPNYSIYPDCDYSLQYFSRGCIRKCGFCVVPEKEGKIYSVKPMNLNPKGKYIKIFDNNFFANPEWKESIKYLVKWHQPVSFDSGLDIRIFNEEQGESLKQIKIHKMIHIAWDNPKQDVTEKINLMIKYIKAYKIMVYVLIGFDSTKEEDYYRVMKLKELKVNPFVMPFYKKDLYQKKFARWVNHKAIFKSVKWKDYNRS